MTLQQLRYVLAAARHGSFSAAAESLYLAQPSLSEQVRRLEEELGVPLFVRVGRGLELTEAGRRFLPEAERVLDAAEHAREVAAEVRELRGGTITFGTFGIAGWYGLADVIETLRRRHPDVRLRAVGQNSSEVADAVRDGRLEAAVVVLPIDDQGLDVRPAIRDEVLYVSSDPERTRRRMSIKRLAEAPLILYDARWGDADPTRRQLAARAQQAGVRLEPIIEVEEVSVALDLAARGLGDTLVDSQIATGPNFPRGLRTVEFSEPLYDTFAFISRRGAPLSPGVRVVVQAIEERVGAQASD
jgi:DNA-binding transcriptional LysR family regulator